MSSYSQFSGVLRSWRSTICTLITTLPEAGKKNLPALNKAAFVTLDAQPYAYLLRSVSFPSMVFMLSKVCMQLQPRICIFPGLACIPDISLLHFQKIVTLFNVTAT